MSSQTIKQLRDSPSAELAHNAALVILNESFVDFAHLDDLPRTLDDARNTKVQLEQHVGVHSASLSFQGSFFYSLLNPPRKSIP